MRTWLALALLLLLAGCSGPAPGPAPVEPAPSVVTDPAVFTDGTGEHIHDYWGGGDRVTVLDATHPGGDERGTGPGLAGGQDVVVRSFQPDSGHVVPQGTAAVEVTVSWTDAPLDSYTDPVLWVKTAAQDATAEAGAVGNGGTLVLPATAADADLPHQLLSAWLFELRMSSPDPMPLRFKGAVALKVEAVRGDGPLPVFPAHPDPWQGAAELPLLAAAGSLSYFEDLVDGGCNGQSCPETLRPESGRLVPHNATAVRVTLEWTSQAFAPQLLYHGGASRDFAAARTPSPQGTTYTFDVPVEGGGDGPYALQSQWEFRVVPVPLGPLRTAWAADYALDAAVVR